MKCKHELNFSNVRNGGTLEIVQFNNQFEDEKTFFER